MLVIGLICVWVSVGTLGVMMALDDSFWVVE